jgi:hypothetical protein
LRDQFGGSSIFFTKVTALFYLAPFLFVLPNGHERFDCKPLMTYLSHQAIPAPYGLPTFETMLFLVTGTSAAEVDSFDPDCVPPVDENASICDMFRIVATQGYAALPIDTSIEPFNPSGDRTHAYITAVAIATKLTEQHRLFSTTRRLGGDHDYRFQPSEFASSPLRNAITAKLNGLRGETGIYRNAKEFQSQMTMAWRGEPCMVPYWYWMKQSSKGRQLFLSNSWFKHI